MVESNLEQFNRIDAKNLFNQWHRKVRLFTKNLNFNCVHNLINNTEISTFNTLNYKKVLNLANTKLCKSTLERVKQETELTKFLNILEERDSSFPRDVHRKYSIEQINRLVQKDEYHPLLFLNLNKKIYIIDGRTRFYCCMFNNILAKVRIISDYTLNENCTK